jgi:hypothetical protein
MGKLSELLEGHWKKGATVVTSTFAIVMAFEHGLAKVSLELRFAVVGVASLAAIISIAEMLRLKPDHSSPGFHSNTQNIPPITVVGVALRIAVMIATSAGAAVLVIETANFHNIRLLQRTNPSDPTNGTIEILPAQIPTNLTITIWIDQSRRVEILEEDPGSWNDQDPVVWNMENPGPYGVKLRLQNFQAPQVFRYLYRLSGPAETLKAEAFPDPAEEVRVLDRRSLAVYRIVACMFGGLLCAFALVFWWCRCSWPSKPLSSSKESHNLREIQK